MNMNESKSAALRFVTPGNADPRGRSRVFYACNPLDHRLFLDRIAEMIWDIKPTTAIWYEDPDEPLTEDALKENLLDINLIVIPVTARLLKEPSHAVNVVLPFANERHIPILPLMMECGQDTRFTQVFGELQYLSPDDNDQTAIPFRKKLEDYINRTLVADETAQKVRDAFDAYIFLSYRKKDRRYARELMRMIHDDPRYEDIAIWYDEYLIPGENFNQTIIDALKKSDIFGLVVTQNLLEYPGGKKNYVMEHEYPMAKEEGKTIFPMEAQKTDRKKLSEEYLGLPEPVNSYNGAAWEKALKDYLDAVISDADHSDPMHSFFIGLAYLDGIDMEVDGEKAEKLITTAAEEGLEPAIRKLIAMYHDGKGVARDYKRSIQWRKTLIAKLRQRAQSGAADTVNRALCDALNDLGDACLEIKDTDGALEAFLEENRLAEETYANTGEFRNILSMTLCRLGDTQYTRGDRKEARKWYGKYLDFSLKQSDDAPLWDIIIVSQRLGNLGFDDGDLDKAEKLYNTALEYTQILADRTSLAFIRDDISWNYVMLGDIKQKKGDYAAAEEYYRQAYKLSKDINDELRTAKTKRDLCLALSRLGWISGLNKDISAAENYYTQALELSTQIDAEIQTPESGRDLSLRYIEIGTVKEASSDTEGAKEWYQKALDLRRKLYEEYKTVQANDDVADALCRLGLLGDKLAAAEAAMIWGILSKVYPDEPSYKENMQRAKMALTKALARKKTRSEIIADTFAAADQLYKKGEYKEAEKTYLSVIDIVQKSYTGSREDMDSIFRSFRGVGDTLQIRRAYEEAVIWYGYALRISKQRAMQLHDPEDYQKHFQYTFWYSEYIMHTLRDSKKAAQVYTDALPIIDGNCIADKDLVLEDGRTVAERCKDLERMSSILEDI